MKKLYALLLLPMTAFGQTITQQNILQGVIPQNIDKLKFNEIIFDRVIYDDRVYSKSRKTELGDQSELDMAFRYHTDATTFARFRMATDPSENRFDNKTSRFEMIFSKAFNKVRFQIDLELLTDDTEDGTDSSGVSLGLDLDSDDTFINFTHNHFIFTFYPFNFRSDVGDEFNTLDVSRINFIEGSPTTVSATQVGDERIVSKTIPGVELQYQFGKASAYLGYGIATYLYPVDSDFSLPDNPTATAWERKETTAAKAGFLYLDNNNLKINVQYVSHNNSNETGALLASAGSINIFKKMDSWLTEVEFTQTKAGDAPWDVNRTSAWFTNQGSLLPYYVDANDELEDWIGKSGNALSIKIGKNFETVTPYISYKQQSEHFIFQGNESAHRLRTGTDEKSHGGLTRVGLGAYFYYDNIYFRPEIEFQTAKNEVFSNATDLQADRQLSSFQKENTLLTINVVYTFDGSSKNQTWWF